MRLGKGDQLAHSQYGPFQSFWLWKKSYWANGVFSGDNKPQKLLYELQLESIQNMSI